MAVDFDELDAVADMVGGVPVAYGLSFRAVRPHTTLHFERDESVHLYVFVDRNNLPVGMSLVHPSAPCVQYREVPRGGDECGRLAADLYGMLSRLAALYGLSPDPAATEPDCPISDSSRTGRRAAAAPCVNLPLLPSDGWRLA